MKKLQLLILITSAFLLNFSRTQGKQFFCGKGTSLPYIQVALDNAQSGDTLIVRTGHYKQGNLFIKKSISFLAEKNVLLDGENKYEILTITGDQVCIKGFTIMNSGVMSTKDLAGIKILACRNILLENNIVINCNFGIYLSNTKHCLLRNNRIKGNVVQDPNTGNGIHVWKADSIQIIKNESTGQRDGIYFEFVTNSTIIDNFSHENLRYGLHFMFSHSNTYTNNQFTKNGAGVAVMYSHHVKMYHNSFDHNWGSSAYGILLKDISDSEVMFNKFEYNSAGIYMEGSNRIKMEQNSFYNNGWALRIQASCTDNFINRNNFTGNTFDVSTNGETQLNNFSNNYWDKYEGYDLNKDGYGDIPYRPVSLFSMIIEQLPPSLLLIRSFMVYLLDKAEKIIPSLTPIHLMDELPQMRMIKFKETKKSLSSTLPYLYYQPKLNIQYLKT
ncbi:MAG: nitrous oxide reductase family maturation protein NosD [Bacteroidetes bacterium]|nr:nitrous oxide reductase family maturation protein NosD [Bacteroidota bacterium]